MKRIRVIACLTILFALLASGVAFAKEGGLKITDSFPEDGQKNTTIENMCVKLTFNNELGGKEYLEKNADCFSIQTKKGEKLPTKVYYDPEEPTKVLVVVDTTALTQETMPKGNTDYKLVVSAELTDDQGNTLGTEEVINFTTLNQSRNTTIYLVFMAVMMVVMIAVGSFQSKKRMAEGEKKDDRDVPFNPYREAKRTGKSVEEVIAIHEKEMAKKAKKAKLQDEEDEAYEDEEEPVNTNYRVKAPHRISQGGSAYITGRKAEAEARAAEEERLAKRRAANKKKKK